MGPFAFPMASIVRLAAPLMIMGIPNFPAAAADADSPSLCTIPCTPTGARKIGAGCLTPNIVVCTSKMRLSGAQFRIRMKNTSMFRIVTLRNILGTILHFSNSARLASPVLPKPALAKTYMNASMSPRKTGHVRSGGPVSRHGWTYSGDP